MVRIKKNSITSRSEANFIDDFLLAIQIRWKIRIVIIEFIIEVKLWNKEKNSQYFSWRNKKVCWLWNVMQVPALS